MTKVSFISQKDFTTYYNSIKFERLVSLITCWGNSIYIKNNSKIKYPYYQHNCFIVSTWSPAKPLNVTHHIIAITINMHFKSTQWFIPKTSSCFNYATFLWSLRIKHSSLTICMLLPAHMNFIKVLLHPLVQIVKL